MFVNKNFDLKAIIRFSGGHVVWLGLWSVLATCFIEFLHYLDIYAFKVPWLPVSLVGTAVAFYVGFKNNSAYDRLWEARKIWGAIVNSSRSWGIATRGFVTNQFNEVNLKTNELQSLHQKLIYRHIAWLYVLRSQLLVPTPWEHINQGKYIKRHVERIKSLYVGGNELDELTEEELKEFLSHGEINQILQYTNKATHIIDMQSQQLKELRRRNLIDDFRHMELQKLLNEFYVYQGKCERIKKFPLPRQYGSMSIIFVGLFIFLLPFGLVTVFHDLGDWGAWLSIPFTMIVGWVFLMMELIGDYSENPFEGLGNDIPMLSLCRTIEIDLREMLDETELPPPIKAKNGVLM